MAILISVYHYSFRQPAGHGVIQSVRQRKYDRESRLRYNDKTRDPANNPTGYRNSGFACWEPGRFIER